MKNLIAAVLILLAVSASAGEHPRLIFRASDLPALRQRMATPEGKAMVAMLREVPYREISQVNDKRFSWIAAGWGMVYQLTGDAAAAETARRILLDQVVTKPVPADRTDVQLAPRLLGVALTYDLCHDAWDAEFRALMTDYLHQETTALYQGINRGDPIPDLNLQPAAYPNAIRMSSVGCAALALLGEKSSDGKPLDGVAEMLQAAERDVSLWLQQGVSKTGRCVEGDFFKAFALANGVLQFLHAERLAGRELGAPNPMLIPGDLLEMNKLAIVQPHLSGRWPMGLGAATVEWRPRLKQAFDREAGTTFDCGYAYHVGYALMNYPFDAKTEPAAPGLFLGDAAHGHFVFRNEWRDAHDFVTVLDLRSQPRRGMAFSSQNPAARLRVTGLGRTWLDDRFGLPPGNEFFGARLLSHDAGVPGRFTATFDLERLLLVDAVPPGSRRKPAEDPNADHLPIHSLQLPQKHKPGEVAIDPELLKQPDIRTFPQAPSAYRDGKTRAVRHVAVDYTGACGAPALYVVVEKVQNPPARGTWQLAMEGLNAQGNHFSVGDRTGPNLAGVVLAPAKTNLRLSRPKDGGKTVMSLGGNEYFLVFTIQPGEPPAITVDGEGLAARVRIGQQMVRFDGEKIVFGP